MSTSKKSAAVAANPEDAESCFAERMVALRKARRLSLDQLAERCGLTKSFLSKVERKVAVPSITTALKVSNALGVRVSHLLGESSDDDAILVVRKGQGRRFVKNTTTLRNTHEALAAGRSIKKMEPFLLRPSKSYDKSVYDDDSIFSVPGEHFCYVVSGEIEIEFQDRIVRLHPGDSIYFDSILPHRTCSVGDEPGEILVIVAPL